MFHSNKNLIHGLNGAGKTSILEAIFLLSFGKSFICKKKSEMVNRDVNQFFIKAIINQDHLTNIISSSYTNRLHLFLDEKKSGLFEINRYFYTVLFSSSDYNLYIESKPYIRKLIDRFIFGVDSLYINHLLSYNNTLKQKNCLLKLNRTIHELRSWNKTISVLCRRIIDIKMRFIDQLNNEIRNKFGVNLNIKYSPSIKTDQNLSDDFIFSQLEDHSSLEIKFRRSLLGPHLDGFEIFLDNHPLRFYSSGEKKLHLLLIYIAFIELFKKLKKDYPVFLLDDFDTAIDSRNIEILTGHYPKMQIIATSVNRYNSFNRLIELHKEK